MTTVFLSGSRSINRINNKVRDRLKNIVNNKFLVVVGDANGADKVLQKYLREFNYENVIVYCSGQNFRNNIGEWTVHHVSVDPKLKRRKFYTEKDKEMADVADYGFVLWDGKSTGSINNVIELLKRNKESLVYFTLDKKFYSISNINELKELLNKCNSDVRRKIYNKIRLNGKLHEMVDTKQGVFNF